MQAISTTSTQARTRATGRTLWSPSHGHTPSAITVAHSSLCSVVCHRVHSHALFPPQKRARCYATGFEPTAPGAAQLASMATVLASTVATGLYWWLVVVPSERASLSRQKRRGAVKEYLEDIEQDVDRKAERWFYTEWREKLKKRKQLNAWGQTGSAAAEQAPGTTDAASTTPPTDSPEQTRVSGQRDVQQPGPGPSQNMLEPTYYTPMPSFFSLDNPIVFVFAALGFMVLVTFLITGGKPV